VVRPSTFHAPGLDYQTDAAIRRILGRWGKSPAPEHEQGKSKPKKRKSQYDPFTK
jgi:hypothetical protein